MSPRTILTLANGRSPLCYLATPYSRYPHGIERAFQDAAALAARLMQSGLKVYSPIAHTHPLAIYGGIDPLAHDIWIPFDEAMMDVADVLIIAHMEGWRESKGIAYEVSFFAASFKPIFDLDPNTLDVVRRFAEEALDL
jgi:nucleoside 2-deoxyribosyltransferase